jgi:hypothetical protein
MDRTAVALFTTGAAFELGGIIAVAWPDLIDPGRRFSASLRRRFEIIRDRWVRLLGRPRTHSAGLEPASFSITGHSAGLVWGVSKDATLEQKVEYLIRRNEQAQQREDEYAARLAALESGTPEQLAELRRGMEFHVAESLAVARREYLPLRILGAFLLALGLACTTTANFVV